MKRSNIASWSRLGVKLFRSLLPWSGADSRTLESNQNDWKAASSPLLEMKEIHKHFAGVHALKGVKLEVHRGEVHALVGENGAGKSTLMHILAGVYPPDGGVVSFNGHRDIVIENERQAERIGIAIVYQERSLFSSLSVAENIYAARQPVNRWGVIDRSRLLAQAKRILDSLGLALDPKTPLHELSPARQQMIEIAKALSLNAKLLIFDEPTAALTESETSVLFGLIHQLKNQQVGIIYISHRLQEIFHVADRVSVLKDGELQGTFPVSETSPEALVARMVGRELLDGGRPQGPVPDCGPFVLEVFHLSDRYTDEGFRWGLKDISFQVGAGEILALAGLAGAGRTELALSIFGVRSRGAGEIRVHGKSRSIRSPKDAIAAGLGYLPEDRKEAGLFLEMSVANNIAAARLGDFGSWWINDQKVNALALDCIKRLRIATPSLRQPVQHLSGGNQQKVLLSRWLLLNPTVLIVDEPTQGIDVGAKVEVHTLLRQLARGGAAVIVISSELPEVLAIADRILVMREGRINGELKHEEATEEKIMRFASMTREGALCQ